MRPGFLIAQGRSWLQRRVTAGIFAPRPGSSKWLINREQHYGGLVSDVPRRHVSPLDSRSAAELSAAGMRGGDRMSPTAHGYASIYSKYLRPFLATSGRLTVVEVGILKGTGLAIWAELFPRGRILGLDIDLTHIRDNMDFLLSRGAFTSNNLELHLFDQLAAEQNDLASILNHDRVDILIDDGLHSDAAILNTLACAVPQLSGSFVYFIEDNASVHRDIAALYPNFRVDAVGEMTVITPR
jgi:hypothetical protein